MNNNSSERIFPPWLIWVIAPVTILAAAIIILALVLGVRAGQRQVEEQRRQQVGIAIQRAMDYRTEGLLEDALAEYQRVLVLDPGNTAAVTGIESLLQIAAENVGPSDVSLIAPGTNEESVQSTGPPSQQSPTSEQTDAPTSEQANEPAVTPAPEEELWALARQAYESGNWREAETALLDLQQSDPDFLTSEVEETLYNIYVNLAAELDQSGDLEQALNYVDKALELHPEETQLREARELAAAYLDVLTVSGADWERTIEMLEALYVRNPGYRDVTELLREAHLELGSDLAEEDEYCAAATQYRSAVAIRSTADAIAVRNQLEEQCEAVEAGLAILDDPSLASAGSELADSVDGDGNAANDGLDTIEVDESGISDTGITEAGIDETTSESAPAALPGPSAATLTGRIMFSAKDPTTGQTNVYVKELGSNTPAALLVENAQQAEFRPDGRRVVYRNLRGDMRGLTSLDPDTGLELRFTDFQEDSRPSWNGEGNRITFSSNREGDRLWRVYSLWADVNNEPQLLAFGDSPAWSRATNLIAYRGCDESGNQCGIWLMNGSGGDNRGFTSVPADDRPAWSPSGDFIAFMSNARDGNPEIYRANLQDRSVTRLTNNGSIDGLPVVSPDGQWVAFVSNRSGSWAVYATPSSGGEAQALFTISGVLDAWQEHSLQWLP